MNRRVARTSDIDPKTVARAQWLRAAVLGANDGLVSVAFLMIGVGAINDGAREMLVSGLAGLVAGACSMAIDEFMSVYAQYDIKCGGSDDSNSSEGVDKGESLPNPTKAVAASALAFTVGAALPLLLGGQGRGGVRGQQPGPGSARRARAWAAPTSSAPGSGLRVLLGGWLAMADTFGILRLFSLAFKTHVVSSA
ncbi:LOW QUALITY PROTEIN: hypothetical protein SORBI_3004G301650 [Sorghum bicolor]|uniref:Vacuolar iron transporter n=1 Tax=Sorghum bicolor TaxID=4558 RepID=A0A1Z5RQN7_SORBI|nr:LOW QUALITY PROTEIN: hypothetical protein SORBI_3004G301650 [Sorghum bicolor]